MFRMLKDTSQDGSFQHPEHNYVLTGNTENNFLGGGIYIIENYHFGGYIFLKNQIWGLYIIKNNHFYLVICY